MAPWELHERAHGRVKSSCAGNFSTLIPVLVVVIVLQISEIIKLPVMFQLLLSALLGDGPGK